MQCVWRRGNAHSIAGNAITRAINPKPSGRFGSQLVRTFAAGAPSGELGEGDQLPPHKKTVPSDKTIRRTSTRDDFKFKSTLKLEPPPKPARVRPGYTPKAREEEFKEKQPWMMQKAALKEKLGEEAWNPRKKLSPDTIDGIRAMHASDPDRFSTPVLSAHFQVTPEAIRRILKSKWQPSPEEAEARRLRWEKRGERIWTQLAEVGVKPPKPWRVMGVGKAESGQMPAWKGGSGMRKFQHKESTKIRKDIIAVKPESATSGAGHGPVSSISTRIL